MMFRGAGFRILMFATIFYFTRSRKEFIMTMQNTNSSIARTTSNSCTASSNDTNKSKNVCDTDTGNTTTTTSHSATRTLYLGVDLHKDAFTTFATDPQGNKIFCNSMATKSKNKIVAFFAGLRNDWDTLILAVESVGFYQWFWELVSPLVDQIKLADASQVRAAAGRKAKTDENDAAILARLLRLDALPEAFVPSPELREFRALVRHRQRILRRIVSCKNSLRMEMNKLGLPGPQTVTTDSLHKWFNTQFEKINFAARLAIDDLAQQLHLFERQLRVMDDRIARVIKETPLFNDTCSRLQTIPGIGLLTAAVIMAETGDLKRFNHEGEISCYAGLTPRVFQSADSCRHGRISKSGPPILRKNLINAAWVAVRDNERIKQRFFKIAKRAGRKKAIVAIARKLLVWAWALEKRGDVFTPERVAA